MPPPFTHAHAHTNACTHAPTYTSHRLVDRDGSGVIAVDETVYVPHPSHAHKSHTHTHTHTHAFSPPLLFLRRLMDSDGSGAIDLEEIVEAFSSLGLNIRCRTHYTLLNCCTGCVGEVCVCVCVCVCVDCGGVPHPWPRHQALQCGSVCS